MAVFLCGSFDASRHLVRGVLSARRGRHAVQDRPRKLVHAREKESIWLQALALYLQEALSREDETSLTPMVCAQHADAVVDAVRDDFEGWADDDCRARILDATRTVLGRNDRVTT